MKLRGDAVWKALFRLVRYRTLWVAAVVVILAAFAYLYTRDVPLRSSYFDLLPKNDPLVLAYEENQIYLASTDSVVLLLTLRDAEDVTLDERKAALLRAAEAIARPLRADPEFKSVVYLIEPAPAIPDQYVALWRLDKESLAKIEDSVALVRGSFGQTAVSVPRTWISPRYTGAPARWSTTPWPPAFPSRAAGLRPTSRACLPSIRLCSRALAASQSFRE